MALDAAEAVRVIQLTGAAGVPCAFLGDAQGNLERGFFHDIDLLVSETHLGKLAGFLVDRLGADGYVLFNIIENEYSLQLYWRHSGTCAVLHVDILPRLTYRGVSYLHIPLEGDSIDCARGFPAVTDADLALYILLRQVLWNGRIARHERLISEAIGRQYRSMHERLRPAVGPRMATRILDTAARGTEAPLGGIRRRFLLRAFFRHPLSSTHGALRHFLMTARRFVERPGLVVVLLGPDGSGKTSVSRLLAESPRAPMGVVCRHLFPGWLPLGGRGAAAGLAVENPHAGKRRPVLLSVLKLIAWYFEFTLGQAARLWRPLERGYLVLFDRFAYDILVDPRRYRYGGPSWLSRVFARAVPRPDLCIALDAPAETLMRRKSEVSFTELERQRAAYAALVGSMRNGRVVDAARPLPAVAADVEDIIFDVLAKRAEKRRGGRYTSTRAAGTP